MNSSKLLSVTAASALALSLAACGGSSGGDTAAKTGASGGSGGKNITLMVGVKGDPFYVSMQCGAQEAADAAGAKLSAATTKTRNRFTELLLRPRSGFCVAASAAFTDREPPGVNRF